MTGNQEDLDEHYLAAQIPNERGWMIRCGCEWHSTGATSTENAHILFEEHLKRSDLKANEDRTERMYEL